MLCMSTSSTTRHFARALMMRKSCTVGMRNAILSNHFKTGHLIEQRIKNGQNQPIPKALFRSTDK